MKRLKKSLKLLLLVTVIAAAMILAAGCAKTITPSIWSKGRLSFT